MTLFVRHTRGLTLTEDGQRVLEIVRPLLALQDKTWTALSQIAKTGEQSLRLGLSTAFEQGVFAALESQLATRVQKLHIVRHGSPELARKVRRENWMQRWWRYRLRIRVLASRRSAGKNR